MPVRPIRVVFDAQFSGDPRYEELATMGDALTEALIDADATDPFVSINAGTGSLLVEIVVEDEMRASGSFRASP